MTLNTKWLAESLIDIINAGEAYGKQAIGEGKKALIEFVSANPTGPIHIAHARGGVVGDTMARLLEMIGYAVEREFYLNDASNSTQMQEFSKSLLLRYRETLGQAIDYDELGYRGEYMTELAMEVRKKYGDDLAAGSAQEVNERFMKLGMEMVIENQKKDLGDFGIVFDNWFSEQTLHTGDKVRTALEDMKKQSYAYEQDGALWLKSTAFGDDKDRVLVRNTGQPTYIAADAAYHKNKLERGFDWLINVWGPDHHGYIARTKAVIGALGYDPNRLKILIYQIVKLFRGNEEVRLSKRTGNIITLREVLDEVGKDETRFFLLLRSHDTDLNFNVDLAKQQSNDNPVFYVQYAHARISSVLKEAEKQNRELLEVNQAPLETLKESAEMDLIKKIADFPGEIRRACELFEPHRLTLYAQELARQYHNFYENCRILTDDNNLTCARLLLCKATKQTLKNTLNLLGVTAPEFMEKKN